MELCVPGGWVQNFSLKIGDKCWSSSRSAMSCVVLGEDATNVHLSKKMRSTPAVAASRARSESVDMSTCSPFPSIANRDC
eukprot:381293-Pleurochrysis_carterae.AAC.1